MMDFMWKNVKVNHFALFIKLLRRRVTVELLQLMENLFSCRYSCVKWDDILSEIFSVSGIFLEKNVRPLAPKE